MSKINEILNSEFFKCQILDIDKENEQLKKDGWSRSEIKEVANFIKKTKTNR